MISATRCPALVKSSPAKTASTATASHQPIHPGRQRAGIATVSAPSTATPHVANPDVAGLRDQDWQPSRPVAAADPTATISVAPRLCPSPKAKIRRPLRQNKYGQRQQAYQPWQPHIDKAVRGDERAADERGEMTARQVVQVGANVTDHGILSTLRPSISMVDATATNIARSRP